MRLRWWLYDRQAPPCRSYSCKSLIPWLPALSRTLTRPAGNITGFALYEYAIAGKWVEMLRDLAPRTVHIGVLHESANSGRLHLPAIANALTPDTQSLDFEVHSRAEIEQAI